MKFLKKLFGIKDNPAAPSYSTPIKEVVPLEPEKSYLDKISEQDVDIITENRKLHQAKFTKPKKGTKPVPEIIERLRNATTGKTLKSLEKQYFQLMEEIILEKKKGNTSRMLQHCQASLGLIEPLIKVNIKRYGRFDLKGIPAIDYALDEYSRQGNIGQLNNIKDIVDFFPELGLWQPRVEEAFERIKIQPLLIKYVQDNPMSWQGDIKKAFPDNDPYLIQSELQVLANQGKIKRVEGSRKKVIYTSN